MIYQISRDEETSSSCSQCKLEHQQGESHMHHHQETSSEEQNVEINSHNRPLNPQSRGDTSSIILVMQDQISKLKRHNEQKDKMIRELRYELEVRPQNRMGSIVNRNGNSTQKLKKQTVISPRAKLSRVYSPQLKTKNYRQTDYQLQIALLEKQIKEYQLKTLQMTNKLSEYSQKFNWMEKFIISFVHMAQDLSLTYGGKISLKGFTLRKKTKISWKYIKELINFLIK